MAITGIICEYNPLHLGHFKQLKHLRATDPEGTVICIMSGNFVQRGKPAIVDKMHRAKAAILCGADLVLELPVTAALSSAEGFAAEGVRLLGGFCQKLCFGAEDADPQQLLEIAKALLSEAFPAELTQQLEKGLSFPAARQAALQTMGIDAGLLEKPNNILAVEYCKAILSQGLSMEPVPICRQGSYHDLTADEENPSATAVRSLMFQSGTWLHYIPEPARNCFEQATLHRLSAGERAMLMTLRTMSEEDFHALPYGSEGLWRKLMHAAAEQSTLEQILTATKSKRYTRSRLDRMVMCAFLGITKDQLSQSAPYARVLALNDRGREALKLARRSGSYPNIGEKLDHPYQILENRCGDLYGLFAVDTPDPPGREGKYRVYYQK